ncbi:MAG TPA: 30S ribosomal protein S20 [Thermoanaerobaculia bacterium]|nr:30S ribosomal protein S20 [Thermoanaerobaculia bacterium]
MANNKSAEKRNRQTLVRNARNRANRSTLRTAIKKLRSALETGNREAAQALLPDTLRTIDVSARKSVIHGNTASRYKSRLSRAVAGLG